MRKFWIALVTVVALTIGTAWAEGVNDGEANKSGGGESACCCCVKSYSK